MNRNCRIASVAAMALSVGACGGSPSSASDPPDPQYRIVTAADGGTPTAVEGNALRLSVVQVNADGTTTALPSDATITWSGPPTVMALPDDASPSQSILPQPGAAAIGMWVSNSEHLTAAQTSGVLYVIDEGSGPNPSITVTATVSGSAPGEATAVIPVGPFPTGDPTSGQALFAANCASCHGMQGQGTSVAPGLDNYTDPDNGPNVAADPGWTGPLFAITPMDNMDNMGVSLSPLMPKWLITPASTGELLAPQSFADMYAWLKTQTAASP